METGLRQIERGYVTRMRVVGEHSYEHRGARVVVRRQDRVVGQIQLGDRARHGQRRQTKHTVKVLN